MQKFFTCIILFTTLDVYEKNEFVNMLHALRYSINLPLCGEYPEFLDICELRRRASEGGCLGGSGAGLFGV